MNNQNKYYVIVGISVIIIIQALVIFSLTSVNVTQAQNEGDIRGRSFSDVVAEFISVAEQSDTIQIAIRLKTPLLENQQTYLVPQYRTDEGGTSRVVSEIGNDYICFDTLGAATRRVECVPFSNIASMDYVIP